MIINYLTLVLASPGVGDLRHPLPNLSDRLILAPQTTPDFPVAQLWILHECLCNSLIPKSPGWPRNHSFAKFLSGRSGVDTVSLAPKREAGVILQKPLTSLWTTFSGIYQSIIQDRRCEFFNRVHKGMVETATFFQCALTSHSGGREFSILLCCPPCTLPNLFSTCLSGKGEDRVKKRYQHGHFWPTPMPGNEQWETRAHVPCHIEVVQWWASSGDFFEGALSSRPWWRG